MAMAKMAMRRIAGSGLVSHHLSIGFIFSTPRMRKEIPFTSDRMPIATINPTNLHWEAASKKIIPIERLNKPPM